MATDQVSFYDESLKKQIEGSFKTDGKSVHVFSAYGNKSFRYDDLGAIIDYNAQVLLVQKILSELARDPDSGNFKDLQKQRDDQQVPPMQWSGSSICAERMLCRPNRHRLSERRRCRVFPRMFGRTGRAVGFRMAGGFAVSRPHQQHPGCGVPSTQAVI